MPLVPDTETFSLQDVYNVVHAENASTTFDLTSCFANSNAGNFDSDYTSYPANSLLRFRNYGNVSGCPEIGDSKDGGIVAYKFVAGDVGYVAGECHGIIIYPTDIGSPVIWTHDYDNLGGLYTNQGWGLASTITIQSDQVTKGYSNNENYHTYAAGATYFGYSGGWWLPTSGDWQKIFQNASQLNLTANVYYWSSSQNTEGYAQTEAYMLYTTDGNIYSGSKSLENYVRAIRHY